MDITKVVTADGDFFLIDGIRNPDKPWPEIEMYVRRIELLGIIQEITDPAELPEYLTDKDHSVMEMAVTRLEQLVEGKNGRC